MRKGKARWGYKNESIIVDFCPCCHRDHYYQVHKIPNPETIRKAKCSITGEEYLLDFTPIREVR